MSRVLHISKKLSLPANTVTGSLIVYGGRGMGKTNFGSVLAEELSRANLKFSVIDPMGVWWGLQLSADGKGPGIEVLLLGGIHGDIPIEPTAGAIVADLVVDENVNVVIDISRHKSGKAWSRGERIKFVYEYSLRLYERQSESRRPLLQIIDEAARFAPQQIPHGDTDVTLCLGALEQLVEESRNIGVGVCFMTQRSARLNKSISELADCMVSFRIIGPRSIEAIDDWLGEHVAKELRRGITEKLRALPVGEALIVSPGWLQFEGVVKIRKRETFDSSATPKAGDAKANTAKARKPNLSKYEERMKETVERAKKLDPKVLSRELEAEKKKVVDLTRKLESKATKAEPVVREKEKRVEVPVLGKAEIARLEQAAKVLGGADKFLQAATKILEVSAIINVGLAKLNGAPTAARAPAPAATPRPAARPAVEPSPAPAKPIELGPVRSGEELAPREQAVIDALREFELLGISEASKPMLGAFAGRGAASGSYDKDLGRLRTLSLITYPQPRVIRLTETGRARANEPERLRSLDEYHRAWFDQLEPRKVKVLKVLIPLYPESISKDDLATKSERGEASGSFDKDLGNMRKLGIISYPEKRMIAATETLFPRGLN